MSIPVSDVCDLTFLCGSPITSIGGSIVSTAVSSLLDALSTSFTQAGIWLVGMVMDLIDSSTDPALRSGWFPDQLARMKLVVLAVVLPILMAASIGPVLRQDARRLLRVWGVGLPVAIMAGLAVPQMVGLALQATDEMCQLLVGPHLGNLAKQYADVMASAAVAGQPAVVQIVLEGLTILAAVLLWLEFTVREAAVYITSFFMPLALVGYIWPATVGMAKRAVEIMAALVLSKFVIEATISLGLAAMVGHDSQIAGVAILLLAAFAPFALMKLAPVVEAAAIAHMEGMSRRPFHAASRAATTAAAAPTHPAVGAVMSARHGADEGLEATPVVAQDIPFREANWVYPDSAMSAGGADA